MNTVEWCFNCWMCPFSSAATLRAFSYHLKKCWTSDNISEEVFSEGILQRLSFLITLTRQPVRVEQLTVPGKFDAPTYKELGIGVI